MSNEPAAKRTKLEAPSREAELFGQSNESGLFFALRSTLGLRASTEEEVGITEYVDPTIPPFEGIIKHRFTDFMVFEVGLDGKVVRLQDLSQPKPLKPEVDPSAPLPVVVAPPAPTPAPEPVTERPLWNDISAAAIFNVLGSTEATENFKTWVLAGAPARLDRRKQTADDLAQTGPAKFTTPVISEKEARTAVHKCLREHFQGRLISETAEAENGDQSLLISWKGPGGKNKERGNAGKPRLPKADTSALPPYIHFTLQKTNREAHDALSSLCRALHIPPRDLGTAGTKDKRAVTTQRVSIKRGTKTIEEVWRASRNSSGGGRGGRGGRGRGGGRGGGAAGAERGVVIGDLSYEDYGFELGMLKGNKFVITLRDVQTPTPTAISLSLTTLRNRGFINYYGMQRFGTSPIPTHAIGLALLQSNWALAAYMILRPRDGEGEDIARARMLWLVGGDAQEAAREMPRRCVAERAILEHYHRSGDASDHLSAITRIPKNLRMMYVHAWQSYIFNRVLSERIKLFGCAEPIVGDLVYVDGVGTGEGDGVDGDGDGAEELGAEDAVGGEEELEGGMSLDADLNEGGAEDLAIAEEGRPSASTSTSTPSSKPTTTTPRTQAGAAAASKAPKARPLTALDISSKTYTIYDIILPLPGFAILYPTGPLGELYRKITSEDGIDISNLFRKQKEYSLGGAYRKIMFLPEEVEWKVLAYEDDSRDLRSTDEDLLRGMEEILVKEISLEKGEVLDEGEKLGLQIQLTLGSSTYATMALREILKASTSEAHQRGLTIAMQETTAAALVTATSVDVVAVDPPTTEEAMKVD